MIYLTCIKDVLVAALQNLLVEQGTLLLLIHHYKMIT